MVRVMLLLCFFKISVMQVWSVVSFDGINFYLMSVFILDFQNHFNNFYFKNSYYLLLTKHDLRHTSWQLKWHWLLRDCKKFNVMGPVSQVGVGNRCSFWNNVFNFLHFGAPHTDTIQTISSPQTTDSAKWLHMGRNIRAWCLEQGPFSIVTAHGLDH